MTFILYVYNVYIHPIIELLDPGEFYIKGNLEKILNLIFLMERGNYSRSPKMAKNGYGIKYFNVGLGQAHLFVLRCQTHSATFFGVFCEFYNFFGVFAR